MARHFVYVGYRADCTKIGITVNPKQRWRQHRAVWKGEIGFSHVFEVRSRRAARKIELAVLRGCKGRIGKEEWFRAPTADVVKMICDASKRCGGAVECDRMEFSNAPWATTPYPIREGRVSAHSEQYGSDPDAMHRWPPKHMEKGPSE